MNAHDPLKYMRVNPLVITMFTELRCYKLHKSLTAHQSMNSVMLQTRWFLKVCQNMKEIQQSLCTHSVVYRGAWLNFIHDVHKGEKVLDFEEKWCPFKAYWGPLHTRDWEPVTITLQALSLVEKAELVQVCFTLRYGPTEYVNARWM